MTTSFEKLISESGEHAVGYFSCVKEPRQIDGGAKCSKDIDNTELVDIYFDTTDTETPYCKPLEDNKTKGYIVMASEVLHDKNFETKLNFYNGKGTMTNVYVQEPGTTFKTTNFKIDAGQPKKGDYAQWTVGAGGPCEKANGYFKVTTTKPETGENIFMVWGTTEDETEELLGLDTIELYVMQ